MGLLDNLMGLASKLTGGTATPTTGNPLTSAITSKISSALAGKGLGAALGNKSETFTFEKLPETLEGFKSLPEAALTNVYAVAALSLLALTPFEKDRELSIEMLNFLKGPEPLTPAGIQQISDRFMDGKFYKVNSFFEGATPANNYTPSKPYKVTVSSNPYSFPDETHATLYMSSGGGDNPRPILLRKKPSTGQWFLVDIQYLGDIRTPVAADKWA